MKQEKKRPSKECTKSDGSKQYTLFAITTPTSSEGKVKTGSRRFTKGMPFTIKL